MSYTISKHVRLDKPRDDFVMSLAEKNRTTYSEAMRLIIDIMMMQSGEHPTLP